MITVVVVGVNVVVVLGVVNQRAITIASAIPASKLPTTRPRQNGDSSVKYRVTLLISTDLNKDIVMTED